jgi:hypothetical protein
VFENIIEFSKRVACSELIVGDDRTSSTDLKNKIPVENMSILSVVRAVQSGFLL